MNVYYLAAVYCGPHRLCGELVVCWPLIQYENVIKDSESIAIHLARSPKESRKSILLDAACQYVHGKAYGLDPPYHFCQH